MAYGTNFGKAVPHWKQREVTWPQFCRLLEKPAEAKTQALSYLMGTLVEGPGVKCKCKEFLHRTKDTVVSRSAITLDADYLLEAGDPDGAGLLSTLHRFGPAAAAHTTWSSEPDAARMRVIIPCDRPVLPLEYGPLSRFVMRMLSPEAFDKTCDQYTRLMYLPSAPDPETYGLWTWGGTGFLDVDFWLDLAGGPDVKTVRVVPEVSSPGVLTSKQDNQLRGLCLKVANCEEGNRDSLFLWALKCVIDDGMDPEIAGEALAEAAIYSGLDEEVVWEKVGRILG
jgi:hypothetical protein